LTAIHGNLQGLSALERRSIERLHHHVSAAGEIASDALAVRLCALAARLGRQVGVLVDRSGAVTHALVGDDRKLELPDLGRWGKESGRLRGLRLVHVHLKGEPVDADDQNDLVRLGLDLVAAITLRGDAPHLVSIAHLPLHPSHERAEIAAPVAWSATAFDFTALLAALQARLQRIRPPARMVDARERALLVHVGPEQAAVAEACLDELEELARTARVEVVGRIIQRRREIDGRTVVGSGKLADLAFAATEADATLLVFGRELSPSQSKTIARQADIKVIDRTQLILDIFARRARTQDGKLQVELAQLRYSLPRLGDRDNALSRLTGGIGGTGPGETKLEIDRRRCRDRIHRLEAQLDRLKRGRGLRRDGRTRADVPAVALVGYTNVGKSSLLNALTKSDAFTEDLLFATLDPTTRRIRLPGGTVAVITDTVGFVRDLPTELKGAFEATLEEAAAADLLIVVVDGAHPHCEDQLDSVMAILRDHGLGDKPLRVVVNKADAIDRRAAVRDLAARRAAPLVSATRRDGIADLIDLIEGSLCAVGAASPLPVAADAPDAADAAVAPG